MKTLTRKRLENAIIRNCKICSTYPLRWEVRPKEITTCSAEFLTDKELSLAYRQMYGYGGKK